eukprot:gnl/TRDRNA2_/TRDRNA2_140579_c0_seq1.p1 gnl/TRDRNA2_/TRDRNA2_140579_c0~~gnl/TRDRNA2_/TRDRNA2_140579_c0_seq1.p1  ORF type:complete len:396 (-),score=76.25 gnl/TRDRNA2_/TRDRNA2_140579_c0_seq1:32-1219(-)
MAAPSELPIVVVGGGISGVSIAYFLAKEKGKKVVVVERMCVGAAAGGKGGGFLAKTWGDGGPTEALHRVSFALHERLASELGISSYRKLPTLQVKGGPGRRGGGVPDKELCSWLDGQVADKRMMDTDTAQVMPLEYCQTVMSAAEKAGAQLRIARVVGLDNERSSDGLLQVKSVRLDSGESIQCSQVVVALGPWAVLVEEWLEGQAVPMEGVKSTSLVFQKQPDSVEPYALFCAEDEYGCHLEVYPRKNGEVYICGCGGSDYIQSDELKRVGPEDILPNPKRVKAATDAFTRMSSLGQGGPTTSQACMRPCPPDATPLLGRLPDTSNAFIAAGHNCWGILWAPVTGLLMSELMVDGAVKCVPSLSHFDPARFVRSAKKKSQRGRHQQGQSVGEQW